MVIANEMICAIMANTRKVAESGEILAYKAEILNSHFTIANDPANSMKQAERFNDNINEENMA